MHEKIIQTRKITAFVMLVSSFLAFLCVPLVEAYAATTLNSPWQRITRHDNRSQITQSGRIVTARAQARNPNNVLLAGQVRASTTIINADSGNVVLRSARVANTRAERNVVRNMGVITHRNGVNGSRWQARSWAQEWVIGLRGGIWVDQINPHRTGVVRIPVNLR